MSRRVLFALIAFLFASLAGTHAENAGVYASKPIPPLAPLLKSLAPDAAITEGTNADGMQSFTCQWPGVSVRVTVDTRWNAATQIAGIKGWVGRFPPARIDMKATQAFLARLPSVTACAGCVITPGFDTKGKVAALLMALAKSFDGYVFTHQSFYDSAGKKIVGFPSDPADIRDAPDPARPETDPNQ